jgi:hypothetical protein
MSAAEEAAGHFGSVPDDSAVAVFTDRGEGLNGALKAVEGVPRASSNHVKTLVIIISTNFTAWHWSSPFKADLVFRRL